MKKIKFESIANGSFESSIEADTLQQLDIVKDGEGHFHVLHEGKAYQLEVLEADYAAKSFVIRVNGRNHKIQLLDQYDQLVKQMGLSKTASQKVRDIKAPMPGLVLEIAVAAGQEVEKGDKLLILEAMKMENVIKSDGTGVVKSIKIKQGTAVDKGQLLIEME